MIGDFLFSEGEVADQIMVDLQYDAAGGRVAELIVPQSVEDSMAASDYPAVHGPMAVESALAYAVILAARSGRSLIVTGDPTVWEPSWGQLVEIEVVAGGNRLTARLS